ncbi:MAG: LamG-like jellyroll fold domain-containing protein [Promethearchaeota archaeon]|jgi:hypothetical protein
MINFSFELHGFDEALTPYGTIETSSPARADIMIDDFTTGEHFRTGTEEGTNSLILELEDRLLTVILDESGSATWNDINGDRYTYFTRLLTKLRDTYPGDVTANLIGFGGVPVISKLLITQSSADFLASGEGQNLNLLLQETFQDSVYDFAGVRVTRRNDRSPTHPADGIVVGEGVFDAVKDDDLTEGQQYFYGVWTFNKERNFSQGRFISGIPQDRLLPRGVNFATATPRILPGVTRDDNTQVIYNFVEGSGTTTFDSSGQGHHAVLGSEVIEENFWLGDAAANSQDSGGESKKPVGVRFDGSFDILEADAGDEIAFSNLAGQERDLIISFWVYRYASSQESWIIGTSLEATTDTIGWAITLDPDGRVNLRVNDITGTKIPLAGAASVVPLETWTIVTVRLNTGNRVLYINGVFQSPAGVWTPIASHDTTGMEKLYMGAFPVDSSTTWVGSDFFGSLAQISIHNIDRGGLYGANLLAIESPIFDQPLQGSSESPLDNTQREVLLSWDISSDFDFAGGQVKIMRKYREIPGHDTDGIQVLLQSASAGQFFFLDSSDFVNNGDYYYRIFTINALGNACDRADARVLAAHIPASPSGITATEPPAVSDVTITNGNRKVMLQWSNPNNEDWRGTKIYFGAEAFPTISTNAQGNLEVSDGFEIFDSQDSTLQFFVHRKRGIDNDGVAIPLENGKFHYYTLITYDRLGFLSDAEFIVGTPSATLTTVFPPAEVEDLHLTIVNPKTLSVQWTNPLVKTDNLELFFGESALIFVNIRDIFGGGLDDLVNISLQVCTDITNRSLSARDQALGVLGPGDALDGPCGNPNVVLINGGCDHGARLEDDCNNEQEQAETVLNFATVESGLIKGILTHTSDPAILTRRERYEMSVRAQYIVENPETNQLLFAFNTESVSVSFQHPLDIALVNKDNRTVLPTCGSTGKIRGQTSCPTDCGGGTGSGTSCNPQFINGTHINASKPYVVRVELQYKGEALPTGTPVNVELFKTSDEAPLIIKSSRVSTQEGVYNTVAIQEPLLNPSGEPTGDVINKSIVDVEIPAPSLPEQVDLYVSLQYLGFFVDAIHTIRFIGSLFIQLEAGQPLANGIDIAEQFSTVWTIDPDNPDNPNNTIPVPDGTLIKWELVKLRHGRDRPFYSVEPINELVSGVYSTTTGGVARNVFFGPVSNVESHSQEICNSICCIGEEYAIKASVILGEETAVDQVYITYPCQEDEELLFVNRFFMNAQSGQSGQSPNYVTWADGESLLRFSIARDPALVTNKQIPGAQCFRNCIENNLGAPQLHRFPENHVVQVTAPGEILWNVVFGEITDTGETGGQTSEDIISAESVSLPEDQNNATAAIALSGDVTDFYLRLNKFIGDGANPQPENCGQGGNGGLGGSDSPLSCEWRNECFDVRGCSPTQGVRWTGVSPISGTSTFISDNLSITLTGGGGYGIGTPPILAGFKEPLDVRVIEARVNGNRLDTQELLVDGISQHTLVVEVKFANQPVPAGTPVELFVEGEDVNIIQLSSCTLPNTQPGCNPAATGIIFTNLVNDPFINPSGAQRSLAYFTIDPLPNIAFNAKINVTCRYDKLGTAEREITRCVELNNTVNVETIDDPLPPTPDPPPTTSVTSNEAIIYDTVTDFYSTTIGASINRMGHFAVSTVDDTTPNIYLFGGFTDRDLDGTSRITATAEKFDASAESWVFITDIPTPRTNGMTIYNETSRTVYCIGGLELDPITDQYVVSRKIESYNVGTGTWNPSLSPMPENEIGVTYGVAFGDAQFDNNDNIYVLCGLTSVVNNNQPDTLNDRILRYTISTDTWTIIRPLDLEAYQRIAPFGFFRDNPLPLIGSYTDTTKVRGYVYGGSIPKTLAEINAAFNERLNQALDDFRSFILASAYYLSLTESEQATFISNEEERIANSIVIPPYIYPATGFKYEMGSEHIDSTTDLVMDISDNLDNEWAVLPQPRDRGQAVYITNQDTVYFMGGANQNQSTTLNRVESIDLSDETNTYLKLTAFSRGRSLFGAVPIHDDIYLSGGLTSGHQDGYVRIELLQGPTLVEAQGNQSSGIVITLRDDAGELIDQNIRCAVRGRLRVPAIDSIISGFLAGRAADRALGGDGSGNAPDLPEPGEEIDYAALIEAQNRITDPNSDQFQFNAAKKLDEQVFLFPVLYSQQEIVIGNGIGGVTLLPRSEDPLADFQRLAQFIKETLASTPPDPNERFQGDLTREELAALGDTLQTVTLPPTILDSNTVRNLYEIETVVTIIDDVFFGQTVSDFDLNIQQEINRRIEELLTPPPPEEPVEPDPDDPGGGVPFGGIPVTESECFLLQHVAAPEIPSADTPPPPPEQNNAGPGGTGGSNQSGQCLFCQALLPLQPSIQLQLPTSVATFYNANDWVPQIKKRLTTGHTLDEVIEEIDIIDHETPFGASQLYSAMKEAAIISTGETFEARKKVFYIGSDNSENFSLISRDDAIDEINAVDGDGNSPVVYTVFSTSFPVSLAAQLERTEVGDIEKITEATGGQSSTLIASGFIDQILNRTIGGATGGLGWGQYTRILDLGELSAITDVTTAFVLPANTQGFLRFRYSEDQFNFNDWTERFEGSQTIDFVDFFARLVQFEIILTTGFATDVTPEYDSTATGIPKLTSIIWGTSGEREDFIFLNPETVLTNAQQVAASFDGSVPNASTVEIGVASSGSHDWRDFQSSARPAISEFGKIFLLERTDDPFSLVPIEPLTTRDGLLYTTSYGAWDPTSTATLFRVNTDGTDVPVLTGFRLHPREGQVYFDSRQPPISVFKLSIVNSDQMRVGLRLRNRLHTDSIAVQGIGYIYSTNDEKPVELSQVAPRAINVLISPQNPDSNDTIFGLYDYIDLNGDPESGTIIKWFKNGAQLFEINNQTSWTNSDLQTNNRLEPNDKLYFSVTPSDGRDFGTTVYSPTVTVIPLPPNAQDLTVIPIRNGIINDRFDTASTFKVEYSFEIDDEGQNAMESGTEIRWFVNNVIFKQGIFSEGEDVPSPDPRELAPTELGSEPGANQGLSAHVIGNEIIVEVTPRTVLVTGERTLSTPFSIVNSLAIISNATIEPQEPTVNSTLLLTYDIDDPDIDDPDSTQSDQSEITWLISVDGTNFVENTEVTGDLTIPPFFISAGEKWKAQIVPFDGLDLGVPVDSNIVTIQPG